MGIFSYLATELSYVAAVMVQAGTGSPALKVHDVHHWVMSCSPNAYMIWAHFQPLYIYIHTHYTPCCANSPFTSPQAPTIDGCSDFHGLLHLGRDCAHHRFEAKVLEGCGCFG